MNSSHLQIDNTYGEQEDFFDSPTSQVYKIVVYLTPAIISTCVFGVCANVINMIMFFRLGFKETINISLFCLAASDLCMLICLMLNSICVNPWHREMDWLFQPEEFSRFFDWMVGVLTIHPQFLVAFITTERCICVILPLKVKLLVTPKVTIIFVTVSFLISLSIFLPWFTHISFSWVVDPVTGKHILSIVSEDRERVYQASYMVMTVTSLFSNSSVFAATITLVVSLRRKSKWRNQTVATSLDKQKAVSTRDVKISNMIIAISSIVIFCFGCPLILILGSAVNAEFGNHEIVWACWIIAKFLYSVNGSINIFFYYNMSSNFRTTFQSMILKTK